MQARLKIAQFLFSVVFYLFLVCYDACEACVPLSVEIFF